MGVARDRRIRRREFLSAGCRLGALACCGCAGDPTALLLPPRASSPPPDGTRLLARLAHVTDTHAIDTASPARFPGAQVVVSAAWRAYEAYSTQLLDGILRRVNTLHAGGRPLDFLLHTGDAVDNAQGNELAWFLTLLDGGPLDPLSGPDDRPEDDRPPLDLDPYAPFAARGLYRQGLHGPLPTIPWFGAFGNHDVYGIGTFPIVTGADGRRRVPLPLAGRPGLLLPTWLDPTGDRAWGNVTPAHPGPPPLLDAPDTVVPDAARAYFDKPEFVAALLATATPPPGHGLAAGGPTGYSVSPVGGLRLIVLDTTTPTRTIPGGIYSEGALARPQLAFLRAELAAAQAAGETVVVATHHPSASLVALAPSEVSADELRQVLGSDPNVVLHLCGHNHRHRVTPRGTYLEIETCSTLDLPQEARLVELWRNDADGRISVVYDVFGDDAPVVLGVDSTPPPADDPLAALRAQARALANGDKAAAALQRQRDPSGADPAGAPADRSGRIVLP
jgi:3',5'-cyclic AMP phosphodiesterase CpdA